MSKVLDVPSVYFSSDAECACHLCEARIASLDRIDLCARCEPCGSENDVAFQSRIGLEQSGHFHAEAGQG